MKPDLSSIEKIRAQRFTGRNGGAYYLRGVKWEGPSNAIGQRPYHAAVDENDHLVFRPGPAPALTREERDRQWQGSGRIVHLTGVM